MNAITQARANMYVNAKAGHRQELVSRRITAIVDMHCNANMKYAISAITVGAVNTRWPWSSVMVANASRGFSGCVAADTWPRVETNTSRAESEPTRATSVRQSKPSGENTGATARPRSAA